jgi:hypothetical protein
MRNILLVFVLIAGLVSCSKNIHEEFQRSLDSYNNLMRQNEFDSASRFAAPSVREEFISRARVKDIRIFDFRIVNAQYDEAKGKASVDVSIDYYLKTTYRAKTLLDREEWAFIEENGVKGWRLMSPPPDFK